MRLADWIRDAIRNEAAKADTASLARACGNLTDFYRRGEYQQAALNSQALRLAYLQTRVPATWAANLHVFREVRERIRTEIRSVLDLGAGPGTAMWAASEIFPSVERFTLVERDFELVEIGRRLAFNSPSDAVRSARWIRQDLGTTNDLEGHDLVVVSYSLGEFSLSGAAELVRKAWLRATGLFVIIEPGTPRNFASIIAARTALIDSGAHVVAPCPHADSCPMALAGDWCHFSQRLERTSEHRRLKGAALSYEDEKFSYFVGAKSAVELPDARIVRHPMKHSGHVQLTLCTPDGLETPTIGKSRKVDYRLARKSDWGDTWQRTGGGKHPE